MRVASSGTIASASTCHLAFCAASFNSGLRNRLRGAFYLCALVRSDDVDRNFTERQSVAKRDEVRRLLCSLDASNPRSREHIAFRDLILRNQIKCLALEPNFSDGDSFSFAHRLGGNVDHLGAAIAADV